MTRRTLVLLSLLLVGLAACGSDDADAEAEAGSDLTIVATTTILGYVVGNVVNGDAAVEELIPLGLDPHEFQASAQQVAALQAADLVVANGLGLEEGLGDVLETVAADGANVLEVAPLLDPIPFGVQDDEGHGSDDPHVWMDPLRMADAARLIGVELAALDPDGDWPARAEEYATALIAADEEIAAILDAVSPENRKMVTNHDSLGYFALRYGFDIVGIVIPGGSTLGDPSSAELAELVAVIEREGVKAIFVETTQPSTLAETVAAEAGEDVQTVDLYTGSLGAPGSGPDSLIGMLVTNAQIVAEASA
jgi:zinc/manganese transport system substrate-binding protein